MRSRQMLVHAIHPQAYFPYAQASMLQQSHMLQQRQQQPQPGEGQPPQEALIAQLLQAGLLNGLQPQEIRIDGLPPEAVGPVALALANLRQRRGVPPQQQGAAAGGGEHQVADDGQQRPPQRLRVININLRFSIRTLLQLLVFAVVAYQVRLAPRSSLNLNSLTQHYKSIRLSQSFQFPVPQPR